MINAFRPLTHIHIETVGFSFPFTMLSSNMQTAHSVRPFKSRCSVLHLIPPKYSDNKYKRVHWIQRLFPLFEKVESSFRQLKNSNGTPFEFSMGNSTDNLERPPREDAVSNIRWNKILAKEFYSLNNVVSRQVVYSSMMQTIKDELLNENIFIYIPENHNDTLETIFIYSAVGYFVISQKIHSEKIEKLSKFQKYYYLRRCIKQILLILTILTTKNVDNAI
jgi:hypothetical protein